MRWAEQVCKSVNSFELGPTWNLKQQQNEISADIDKYRDLSQDSGLSGSLERLKDSANPRLSTLKLSRVWSCRVAAASRWVSGLSRPPFSLTYHPYPSDLLFPHFSLCALQLSV